MNCRMNITGQKTWLDNDNEHGTRPTNIEIVLYRDNEIIDKKTINSAGNWKYTFPCMIIWNKTGTRYNYRIDETNVPEGYTKKIDGFNITNTHSGIIPN